MVATARHLRSRHARKDAADRYNARLFRSARESAPMSLPKHHLELLSPARDVAIAGLSDTLTVAALARQVAGAVLAPASGEATISVLVDRFEPAPGTDTMRAAE